MQLNIFKGFNYVNITTYISPNEDWAIHGAYRVQWSCDPISNKYLVLTHDSLRVSRINVRSLHSILQCSTSQFVEIVLWALSGQSLSSKAANLKDIILHSVLYKLHKKCLITTANKFITIKEDNLAYDILTTGHFVWVFSAGKGYMQHIGIPIRMMINLTS